jgi:hypothetical protein
MPVEIIGEFGTPGAEREWIVAECELAIKHLVRVCGEPPPEMDLEIQWQEHDSGAYPVIVLSWEDGMRAAPSKYIERCEDALATLAGGEAPPRWRLGHSDAQDPDDEPTSQDPDFPKEPEGDAGFFDVQDYMSKLLQYSLNKR